MLLTADEYERGLVTWRAQTGVTVELLTHDANGVPRSSGRLRDPDGSVLPFKLVAPFSYRIGLDGEATRVEPGLWIKLERVNDGVLVTHVWPTGQTFRHVPDYSTYHRLVVDASSVDWPGDRVLRHLTLLIRFVTGKVECERTMPFGQMTEEADGNFTLAGGGQETASLDGRFIDIVAPGATPQSAEVNARAVLGLLALIHGPGVLGPVVSSESYDVDEHGQRGRAVIPVAARAGRRIDEAEFEALDRSVDRLTVDGRVERARLLSLHWYERGLRSSDPGDAVLAFFVGIEALVTAYAAEASPLPVEIERRRTYDVLFQLAEPLGPDVVRRLQERLLGPSLTDQFAFYADRRGLGGDAVRTFREIKDIRDRMIHGDSVEVAPLSLGAADRLLRRMLKDQFELRAELAWEQLPSLLAVVLEFAFGHARAEG